jgi:hypothetical protein
MDERPSPLAPLPKREGTNFRTTANADGNQRYVF